MRWLWSMVRGLLCGVSTGLMVAALGGPAWAAVGFGISTWSVIYTLLFFLEQPPEKDG